jgi:hypothetical protein
LIYCTGIDTRNTTIVNKLGEYLDELILADEIDTSFISGDKIKLDLSMTDDEIRINIIEKQMSQDEADRLTDSKDNSEEYLPAKIDKEIEHKQSTRDFDNFDLLLMSFGNAIRNTELSGFDIRQEAYKKYIKGTLYWCSTLANLVSDFVLHIKEKIFSNNNSHTEIKKELDEITEKVLDIFKIVIPFIAEGNMYDQIGTKKSGRLFTDYYYSIKDYNALDKFLSLLMCCDLKLNKWKEILDDFIKNCKSKDLRIVLFFKLVNQYQLCHFGNVNNKYVADKLFELKQTLDKNFKKQFGVVKTDFINNLNKKQLLTTNAKRHKKK